MCFKNLSREAKISLGLIAAFIFLFFSPVVSGDGFGYYAILEGIGKDSSLDLVEQQHFNEVSGMPVVEFNEATQKHVSQYAPGPAIISLPAYLVSEFLAQIPAFHIADDFFVNERGALLVNQLAFTLTALAFVAIALFFSVKITKKYFPGNESVALAIAFFGSPLLWYASADLGYSHAFEAGLMALLVYATFVKKDARLQGVFLGLLTLTRYSAGIFVLPLLAFHWLKGERKDAVKFGAFFAPFVLLLMLYFQTQFGSPFSSGYTNAFDSFLPIHLIELFFDLNRGILLWTPAVIAAIAGLFYLPRNEKLLSLSFVALNIWIYSAWSSWHSAWGFGNRFFIILFPLFVLGIASLIKQKPKLRVPLALLGVYTFLLSLLFLASTPALADPFNFTSLIAYWLSGNAAVFIPALVEKISIMRAIALF